MPVRNRYIILSALLWLASSLCTFAQVTSLSDAQIPCDKVFAVHGDVAIGADNVWARFRNVVVFETGSGEVISSHNMSVHKEFSIDGVHYFLTGQGNSWWPRQLYLFENGVFSPAVYSEALHDVYFEPTLNTLLGLSDEGIVLLQDGMQIHELHLGMRPLKVKPHGSGFLAIADSAYFVIGAELDYAEQFDLPAGYASFGGAVAEDELLLTGEVVDSQRTLALYNITTHQLSMVVDETGAAASVPGYATPTGVHDGQFFIAGCGLTITDPSATMALPTDAGFVDPVGATYTAAIERISLWQVRVLPVMLESANGPVVFGRMGIEGVEPYTFKDQKLEVLKDIYRGFGSSIAFDRLFQSHWGHPGSHPNAIEVVAEDGILYFAARSSRLGMQVWRTDGTEDGTFAVTDIDLANKGFVKCFIGKDDIGVLFTGLERNGERRLYRVGNSPKPIGAEPDEDKNWEVAYATNPMVQGGSRYFENEHPGVFLARDGTSVLVLKRMSLWIDHLSFNQHWALPTNKIQGFYVNTAIQITRPDGSLKSSTVIRAREFQQRTVGRAFDTGHVYALVAHRPFDTFINENVLSDMRHGHYLIELDPDGQEVASTFLPTGGQDRISFSQIKVTDEGIYLLGMADSGFEYAGSYTNVISSGKRRAVLIKFNLNHTLQWMADSGLDQDIFGRGLHNLAVGEKSVFMATGGTAYSVSSSCAFSEWPYQISCFDASTGNDKWQTVLQANDVSRITSMNVVGDQWLWIGGYTRGDLAIGDRQLSMVPNYLNCSYNSYLLCLQTESGTPSFLAHSDPSRAKFIQDIQFRESHLYALSMVYEEDLFPVPVYGHDGRWNLQIDKLTNGGLKVDSVFWPTSIHRTGLHDRLVRHKFSFDFHPEGGIVLAGTEIINGTIDAFTSPASDATRSYLNSWLIQRRGIQELEDAGLPPEVQPTAASDFEIYPNPLSGHTLVLKIPHAEIDKYDQIVFTDMHGRRCMQQNLTGPFESRLVEVDGNLANGVYIVELLGTSRSAAKKLVLRR